MEKKIGFFQKLGFSFLLVITQVIVFAQDKGVDIDVDIKKESDWYMKPWVWVVGAAVFILLLVALLRGGRKSA